MRVTDNEVRKVIEGLDLSVNDENGIKDLLESYGDDKSSLYTRDEVDYEVDNAIDDWRGKEARIVDLFQSCINSILENTEFKTQKNRKEVEKEISRFVEEVEYVIDDGLDINYKH